MRLSKKERLKLGLAYCIAWPTVIILLVVLSPIIIPVWACKTVCDYDKKKKKKKKKKTDE